LDKLKEEEMILFKTIYIYSHTQVCLYYSIHLNKNQNRVSWD